MTPQASTAARPDRIGFNTTDAAKLFFGALLTGIVFNLGAIAAIMFIADSDRAPAMRETVALSR